MATREKRGEPLINVAIGITVAWAVIYEWYYRPWGALLYHRAWMKRWWSVHSSTLRRTLMMDLVKDTAIIVESNEDVSGKPRNPTLFHSSCKPLRASRKCPYHLLRSSCVILTSSHVSKLSTRKPIFRNRFLHLSTRLILWLYTLSRFTYTYYNTCHCITIFYVRS